MGNLYVPYTMTLWATFRFLYTMTFHGQPLCTLLDYIMAVDALGTLLNDIGGGGGGGGHNDIKGNLIGTLNI